MNSQRIRMVPEPPPSGRPRRAMSLRRVLWLGTIPSIALAIIAFVVVTARILDITDRRADVRSRYHAAMGSHKDRLAALYEQQMAQRAYVTLGDPELMSSYDSGRQREIEALGRFSVNLGAADHRAIDPHLSQMEATIHHWRETVWRPRLLARQAETPAEAAADLPTTLATAEAAFKQVRATHRLVDSGLEDAAAASFQDFKNQLRVVVIAGVVLLTLTTVFMVVVVAWALRRTVRPLELLSKVAASGGAFPRPDAGTGILEVDTLTQALYELDITVRDREQRVAVAHAEALAIGRFSEHVQQITDEDELHGSLAAHLQETAPAAAVHTLMRNSSASRLDVALSTSGPIDRLRLPILAAPMKCRAVRTLKPVADRGGSPTACRCELAPAGGAYLCEPMLAAGELVGVVNLQAEPGGGFDDESERRVRNVLGFASTALASIRLLAATRDRALRDPLTGAYNRAFLDEYLGKQLAMAERNDGQLAVMLVDLDHFKRLNDTYGHQVGDRALVAAVAALIRTVRASDAVVRYGGEELAVVLPETGLAGALEVAERARKAIENISISTEQGTAVVRASIGVSAYPGHGRDHAALIACADRALYQAKASGRNRVVAADLDGSPPAATSSPPVARGN